MQLQFYETLSTLRPHDKAGWRGWNSRSLRKQALRLDLNKKDNSSPFSPFQSHSMNPRLSPLNSHCSSEHWLSAEAISPLKEHQVTSGDTFGCCKWRHLWRGGGAVSTQWVKTRATDKHPTTNRTVSTTENYSAQDGNDANVDIPCFRVACDQKLIVTLLISMYHLWEDIRETTTRECLRRRVAGDVVFKYLSF